MAAPANPDQVPVGEPPEPARRDFRREVPDRIINMLENGVAPWQKEWNPADASLDMPMNPTTSKTYRGGNAIHLMATGLHRGYGEVLTEAPLLDPTKLGDRRNAFPERETRSRERGRRDREARLAPSAGSAGRTPNLETLGRARTTGRGR